MPENIIFDADAARNLAHDVITTMSVATLATLLNGHPIATLVTFATDDTGAPILLLSDLSMHTKNIEKDNRVSLLIVKSGKGDPKGDPLAYPRITVSGILQKTKDEGVKTRFLSRNPKAKLYVNFADFSFWRLNITSVHINGGFAKAMTFETNIFSKE